MSDLRKYVVLMGAGDDRLATIYGFNAAQQVQYEWPGHTEFGSYLAVPPALLDYWYLLWFTPGFQASQPRIIINSMANADLLPKALRQADQAIDQVRQRWPQTPVFNPPRAVLDTTRDRIAARHAGLLGLVLPRVARCRPDSRIALLAEIEAQGLRYPVIVRRCGGHGGHGVALLRSVTDALLLEPFAFDGGEFYLTEFIDYRGGDGLYTKIRLVWIGGTLYPRHAISSDHWLVHARSRAFMADQPTLQAREAETLRAFASELSPDALRSLHEIGRTSGLDYLGFDGCILPDGRFLVFEINASQNAMAPSDYKTFPYLQPHVAAIIQAFNAIVQSKIAAAGQDV